MQLMHALQSLACDVGVNLCCRDIAVAEQHLHYAQVGAVVEKVRRKGVPEGMWRQGIGTDARRHSVAFDQVPEGLSRHRFAARRQEHKVAAPRRAEPPRARTGHVTR